NVGTALSTLFGGEAVFGDDIGNPDTATRREDAEHLGKDGGLVGGEVDDAVVDHHTHRPVRKRYVLDGALEELDVLRPGLDLVLLGQGEHFVGHVHAVGEPGRSDTACGEQHIDAATGAEVVHPLTLVQLSDRRGIATARAGLDRLQWESGGGRLVVETRAEAPLGRSAARVVGRLIRSLCSGGAGTARRDRRLFDQEVSVAGAGGDRGRGLGRAARCSRARSLRAPLPAGCPDYIWMLVDASTVVNAWRRVEGMPISLPLLATDTGGCCAPVTGGVLAVEDAQQLARMFKALGDPTRVRLLSMITAQSGGEACVCNLTEPVGLSQPTVSHHVQQLRDAGLVTREQRGKWAYYAVVPEILGMLSAALDPQILSTDTPACSC